MNSQEMDYLLIRSTITFSLAISFLLNLIFKSSILGYLNFILMAVVLLFGLLSVTGTTRVLGYASLIISIFLLVFYQAPLGVWKQAFQANMALAVMFTVVPLLSIPIDYGGYTDGLGGVLKRYANTDSRFYLLVSILTSFMSVMINFASVPLIHQICLASDKSANKRLLVSAITRGFANCTIWAPTLATVALILNLSGAQWILVFPYGFLLAGLSTFIGWIIFRIEEKAVQIPVNNCSAALEPEVIDWSKVIELSIIVSIMITGIAVVSLLTGITAIILVSLTALFFPLLWLGYIRKLPVLPNEFKGSYFRVKLPKIMNDTVLFVGAGIFSTSISFSHLGAAVPRIIWNMVGNSTHLFFMIIFISVIIISLLGIHPIVAITLIGGTVKAPVFGVSTTFLALILLSSYTLGTLISPSSGLVTVGAGFAERSTLQVGPAWNGLYVMITAVVFLSTLFALRGLGLI